MKIFRFIMLFSATFLFLFVSCESFFNGSELKSELDKKIENANSTAMEVSTTDKYGSVKIDGMNGKCKLNDSFIIDFVPSSEYYFLKWTVQDGSTGNILSDEEAATIVEFDDWESDNTVMTIVGLTDKIKIVPQCLVRPTVITHTPSYTVDGVYKNQTIVVMFDSPMSLDSIYFTDEEIDELRSEGISYSDFLTVESSSKYINNGSILGKSYGYKKNGEIVYKNIKIENSAKKNLLGNFGEPYFASDGRSSEDERFVLRIPAGESPPDSGELITVTIAKDMFTVKEEKEISLSNRQLWAYYTNAQEDTNPPSIDFTSLTEASAGQTEKDSAKKSLSIPSGSEYSLEELISNRVQGNENKIYLWIEGTLSDSEGGISSAALTIKNISHSLYYPDCEVKSQSVKLDYTKGLDSTVVVNQLVSFDMTDFDQGVYEACFSGVDSTGLTASKKLYFVWDDEIDLVSDITFSRFSFVSYTDKISFTVPTYDFANVKIKYKYGNLDISSKVSPWQSSVTQSDLETDLEDISIDDFVSKNSYTYTFDSKSYENIVMSREIYFKIETTDIYGRTADTDWYYGNAASFMVNSSEDENGNLIFTTALVE